MFNDNHRKGALISLNFSGYVKSVQTWSNVGTAAETDPLSFTKLFKMRPLHDHNTKTLQYKVCILTVFCQYFKISGAPYFTGSETRKLHFGRQWDTIDYKDWLLNKGKLACLLKRVKILYI